VVEKLKFLLKGQSHVKVCEIMTWDVSFGLNKGSLTVFLNFQNSPLKGTIFQTVGNSM
jgi:hypothetical protein